MEARGLRILPVSLRRRRKVRLEPSASRGLPVYLPGPFEPRRLRHAWRTLRAERGYADAREAWLADFRMEPRWRRILAFLQAMALACELPEECELLHAQSLSIPADVARYAAAIRRLPWSCSAHAEDIWTTPEWDKRTKLEDCRWLVACTAIDARHLQNLSPAPGRVELVYHGLELSGLPEPPSRPARDGSDPGAPVILLAVGPAEEKAGLSYLLDALGGLRHLHWRLVHVGGGPLVGRLKLRAVWLRISGRLTWLPPLDQDRVRDHCRTADIFTLPSCVTHGGIRDGLPQTLLEAQSQGLACVATSVGGIPELVTDGETGVLVPERDAEALRLALAELVADPGRRASLGAAANERVRTRFGAEGAYERLADRFGLPSLDRL